MEMKLYDLNYSQDIVYLQTKYSLFSRVANIIFSTTVDEGFDESLMTKAINLLFKRNDCLRLTLVKESKTKINQYFVPEREVGSIPTKILDTQKKYDNFLEGFRKGMINVFKGETLKVVYTVNPDGKQEIFFKISHLVCDSYGIGVLVSDLFAVYKALKEGKALPEAPGSFEEVLAKDMAYKANNEAVERDRSFFSNYYENVHAESPTYCGIHGNGCDRWRKEKAKGGKSLPYLFIKCDTKGYRFVIPAAVVEKAEKWCEENQISLNAFFFYTYSVAASLVNNREKYQIPLMLLNCRGTVAERRAAGTKVQSISLYTTVDYEKSFLENIKISVDEQNEFFRHTKLSYLELEAMQHKQWNFSMLRYMINFCYSFIPFSNPEGISLQIHSNGKGSLVTYLAFMHNIQTNEIFVNYDIQTEMVTPLQLVNFQNTFVHVVETVLADSESKLGLCL